ncbi:hypothetical protein BD626DRAFT_475884 [Schizophyllum amplum]|uniref:DASH complex subunit DUO1 n=1 Tax=Schizophyllum amplum TaxID=97359 RepID=A0A550CYV6_9AGAR|nr:hypothetical protein BD626DRAFT_475884 [Auriculariopsis ampla]
MHSPDDSLMDLPSGSHLLSESPLVASSSRTGPYGDDLSLSELDQTVTFERAPGEDREPSTPPRGEGEEQLEEGDLDDPEAAEKRRRIAGKRREDKLQNDLFILRKLNTTFAALSDSMKEAHAAKERVGLQLEQTDALLNRYTSILALTEDYSRLILDEDWQGGEKDEEEWERTRREEEERIRREAEARAEAERREQERREREEAERQKQEERERLVRERKERQAARGTVTGVRGTRASMRGLARGSTRGTASTAGARPSSATGARSGTQVSRRGSTTSRGAPRPS